MRFGMIVRLLVLATSLWVAPGGRPAMAQIDLFSGDPVVAAVAKNDLNQLRLLINRRTSLERPGSDGRRALALAAGNAAVEVARILVDARANPNAPDNFGGTPLHWAVKGGSVEIVEMLLAAGSRVDQEDRQGVTPLMQAARDGRPEVVQMLLKAGAQTRKTDYSGRTALDWAREGRSASRVVTILEQASR
jgi:uncharacterized protein